MYFDVDTGRVLFGDVPDAVGCIYRISADETIDTLAGRYPAAYFDHVDWPRQPRPHSGPLTGH
jgi:hypothetical protein